MAIDVGVDAGVMGTTRVACVVLDFKQLKKKTSYCDGRGKNLRLAAKSESKSHLGEGRMSR